MKIKNLYKEHLKQMEDHYYTFFKDLLSKKYGELPENLKEIFWGNNLFSIDGVKGLNSDNNFRKKIKEHFERNQYRKSFPLFIQIKNYKDPDWLVRFDGTKTVFLSLIDYTDNIENYFKGPLLRKNLLKRLEHNYSVLYRNIKIPKVKKDKDKFTTIYIDISDDNITKEKNFGYNASCLNRLIEATAKYRLIVTSYTFHDEEENFRKTLDNICDLYLEHGPEKVKTILNNIRLGNNLSINLK